MNQWTRIASVDDCPPGAAIERVHGDRVIAIFNVDGSLFALDGICPHQGGPLGQGALSGCIVTCPWHGWQFDVSSGQHQTSQSLVHPGYSVKVIGTEIMIDLADDQP